MSTQSAADQFFDALEQALPPVFTREEASRQLGGLFRAKTLCNLDHLGKGPEVKVKVGKKTGYEKRSFLNWLRQYSS